MPVARLSFDNMQCKSRRYYSGVIAQPVNQQELPMPEWQHPAFLASLVLVIHNNLTADVEPNSRAKGHVLHYLLKSTSQGKPGDRSIR